MSFDYLSEYQTTAGDNTAVGSVNIQENCAPSVINNAIREVMSHLAGYKAETITGAAVASATALLVNIPGVSHSVTGTTTITSLASPTNDTSHIKLLTFAGALTFTHGSSLILPGAANITTVANDVAIMSYEGSDVWRCVSYVRADGTALVTGSNESLTTGDVKLTYKTTADSGFVMADDGSIGSAASGASNRANADTETLYTLFYNNMSDSECPVSSGRGANAAADFAANKTLTIPVTLGRALGIAGTGASLTARTLGDTVGEETHVLTGSELTSHLHANGFSAQVLASGGGTFYAGSLSSNTGSTGSSTAFNVVQPTTFLNIMVKL